MPDQRGVLVTLDQPYVDHAEAEGRKLHAKHGDSAKFGKRTLTGRIASSGAKCAVEQLHGIAPGALRKGGLDCASTRNPNLDFVHVRPAHRGRLFFVVGPLDGEPTYLVLGSIDVAGAKTRPMDMTLDPPAHVWRVSELDPPPDCGSGAQPYRPGPDPKPDEQLQLQDQRAGRVHDRKVGA